MHVPRLFPMLATAILTLAAGATLADATQPVPDRVEEDWQLVVAQTDAATAGPQITTCMSPVGDDSTPFVAFDLNYREYPTFLPGGMQVQVWSGKSMLSAASQGSALFATPGETITWTQTMVASGGVVTYQIDNGQSSTWGKFGQGNGQLCVNFNAPVSSLAGYSPDRSAANSGVTWESNYVTSLTLVQVRYYSNGQLIATDATPRPVDLGN